MNKILVVDDDPDILSLVETILTMDNFSVQAILKWECIDDSINNFKPDLILLDISLSGADGRDICKKIKQSKETQHLPVILFSANTRMENDIENFHAQHFIAKPFELSYLIQTIKFHLGRQI
jgi:DNA-binding response OmpR family regulator